MSCTVTKRVHRPGYHVQWRSIHRTQASQENLTKQYESSAEKEIESALLPTKKATFVDHEAVEMEKALQSEPVSSQNNLEEKTPLKTLVTKQLKEIPAFRLKQFIPSSSKSSTKERSSRPILWRISPSALKTMGIICICLGIFLLLGSALVSLGAFSGAGNGNGAAWLNFFLDLIAISEWFWLLIFIVLLVLLLYLAFLFVRYVMGGALVGLIVGAALFILGVFFYALGTNREEKMTE